METWKFHNWAITLFFKSLPLNGWNIVDTDLNLIQLIKQSYLVRRSLCMRYIGVQVQVAADVWSLIQVVTAPLQNARQLVRCHVIQVHVWTVIPYYCGYWTLKILHCSMAKSASMVFFFILYVTMLLGLFCPISAYLNLHWFCDFSRPLSCIEICPLCLNIFLYAIYMSRNFFDRHNNGKLLILKSIISKHIFHVHWNRL